MIVAALKTLTGQISVVLLAATAAWGWLKMHDRKVEKQVVEKVVRASEKKGAANAAKSKKAHDAARAPGAAERLLDGWGQHAFNRGVAVECDVTVSRHVG